jgi:hypothetical protein
VAGVIKGVLQEELENSLRMKKQYEEALPALPQGCLVVRRIKGHEYCYLVRKVKGKLQYSYQGKLSPEEKKKYEDAKKMRAKYRHLLSRVKKQIRFLRSSLRGKEAI